ncbi:hypothetical protein [Nocardia wallacei]|uniref:hypothetical protein n=1 Tax=Nocardia wallacei TaxID=480035 RepID=UPI0024569A7E|nr:hypothetical protein [Nocardia wallacei]
MMWLLLTACGVVPFAVIGGVSWLLYRIERRRIYRRDVEHYNRWLAQMDENMRRVQALKGGQL